MIRGWCPGVHDPMETGDGWLARVTPPGARLSSAAARAVADAAAEYGNGTIELTRRGNIQVRGLSCHSAVPFAAAMVGAGLADPDPARDRRRIVMPPPLAGDDPAVPDDGLAARIEARVPAGLPPKFCIAIAAAGVLPGHPAADVVVRTGSGFDDMDDLAAATGRPRPPTTPAHPPARSIGFLPYDNGNGAFGVGLPFGQTDAAGLRALAGLADRFSSSTIRTSPWRAFLLGRIASSEVAALMAALAAPEGFVTDPSDPRLSVTSCIGAPGCGSATVLARADAARLAATTVGRLHVSGCAKGCAYPGGPALVGVAGRYVRVETWRPGITP